LNGSYISTSGVVLRPGQRVFLERFLDSNNKFEFSTYEVTDTSENRSAIDLNGDVKIEFYDEKEPVMNNFLYLNGRNMYDSGMTYGGRSNDYIPKFGTTISTTGGVYHTTTTTYNTSNAIFTSSVAPNILRSKFDVSTTLLGSSKPSKKKSKSIETGRVEKGEQSNQSFTNSYEQFNDYISHKISFKIQPLSTKNKTKEDIRQYCTECGTKTKSNFKFCPSCGNKL
jgi:hypothetical protein